MILNQQGQTLDEFLSVYDANRYPRPSVTVDMAVFTLVPPRKGGRHPELALLLIERKDHPFIGTWALPGGFINMDETLIESAKRELMEETSLSDIALFPLSSFDKVDRDPRTRVITFAYAAVAPMGTLKVTAGDDAADAKLFVVDVNCIAKTIGASTYQVTLSTKGVDPIVSYGRTVNDPLRGSIATPCARESRGLASDHSDIVFAAVHALSRLDEENLAKAFAGENCSLLAAMDVVDEISRLKL